MLKDVVKEYILKCFPENNEQEMAGINNVKLDTLMFCTNVDKLDKYVDKLLNDSDIAVSIDKLIRIKNGIDIRFKDGRRIVSTGYYEGARGYRYNKLILDLDELKSNHFFDYVIVPMGYACKRSDVSFI